MVALIRFLCLLLFLSGNVTATFSQTYKITRFSLRDSLPEVSIHDIDQDSAGFVWVASAKGLYRYDGNLFVQVHRDEFSYLAYHKKSFLAGNRNLFKLNTQFPFENISFQALSVQSDTSFRRENLLVSDSNKMWWSDTDGIHSYRDKIKQDYRKAAGKNQEDMFFLLRFRNSMVGINEKGQLFHFSYKNVFTPFTGEPLNIKINAALAYNDTSIVVATTDGLIQISLKGTQILGNKKIYSGTNFTHVIKDSYGNLWAASSENKLYKFYPDKFEFVMRMVSDGSEPHRVTHLTFPAVKRLFIDRHNNLWVGHDKGLALVSEIPFILVDPELPNEIIRSVAFLEEGKVYLSGIAGFFETVSRGHNKYEVRRANLGSSLIPTAVCRCNNRLWLGTVKDEVYYFENNRLSKPFHSENASNIFYLFCDTAGDVWVSRGQKYEPLVGIVKISRDLKVKEYGQSSGFTTRMLVTKQDPKGDVYVAGIGDSTYLYRYDRSSDSFINLSLTMHFPYGENFEVHDFAVSEDGTFWLASTAGLLKQKGDSIQRIDIPDLFEKEVVAVTLSKDNVIWAATEKDGLVRYTQDGNHSVFDIKSGLQSGIMWYRSLFTDSEGKIWAGSREGMTVSTHPSPMAKKTETPVLLSVSDENMVHTKKRVFNYQTTLRFDFISLNFPGKSIVYQYTLDPEKQDWKDNRSETFFTLPELESGKYKLYIRSRQAGGYYWSDPVNYTFTVLPPWYYSKEAFLIYSVFLIVAMVFSIRVYNRRLIREKHRLENKVRARTQELVKKQEEIIAQNQELHQLSDVLAANHENIVKQKEIIQQQNILLSQAKAELEKKVHERTHELKVTNEELAQQNVQLEQFAFMTAHNLRAPVARLLGLTSLLDMETVRNNSKDGDEILKRIKESSRILDETIREISEILHIKKGLHGSFIPVSLKDVWNKIIPSFRYEIDENRITINEDMNDTLVVKGVEPFVYSVFYNIISNSIKYSDNRKDSFLNISSKVEEDTVVISFQDNGIGFNSSQYADKLFKPFTRFNNIKEGRGLGLYLMKIQMEMMDGNIELQSTTDVGTTIILTFCKEKLTYSGSKKTYEGVN
jgi:signal transduction histidine kinase